jgi:hypothetical protein
LLKTFVTFLIATPSPVWPLVAALHNHELYSLASAAEDEGSPDDAIGTLSQLLGHIVPLVYNELLVEDLEHLATLQIRHDVRLGASDGMREGVKHRLSKRRQTIKG